MSAFTAIELEKLPAPQIVEALSFETIKQAMLDKFIELYPQYTATVESDPVYKLLEVAAYRELLLRQRVNDAAKGVMLAYAVGSDLDNLSALYGVSRQLVYAGDSNAIPPIPAVYESDSRLRYRTQLALEGFTTAGSEGSYVFWGLSASPLVKDIDVQSPTPGHVWVTVLSSMGDGMPTTDLLTQVESTLNADEVRPLTDFVTVKSPTIYPYAIQAELVFYKGPDAEVVRQLAEQTVTDYANSHHLLGHDITLSGLYHALHQTGVQNVILHEPSSDLVVPQDAVAFCTHIQVTTKGLDE